MWQNLSSAAVVIGALRVKLITKTECKVPLRILNNNCRLQMFVIGVDLDQKKARGC